MYCTKCGNELPEDARFCGKCGASIQQGEDNKNTNEKGSANARRGLVNTIADSVVEKVSGIKTMAMSVEELTDLISSIYIDGVSEEGKNELKKAIKGGLFRDVILKSKDGRYTLLVGSYQIYYAPFTRRTVWIEDHEMKVYYQLAKDRWYKKLKAAVNQRL